MFKVYALTLVLALASFSISAADQDTPAAAKIRAVLKTRYPNVAIKQIAPAPMLDLYELVTDAGLAYTDSNANYLIVGKILDTKTQEDLTETRWNELNAIDFDTLPFELAIKFVKGNGKRRLAVFEDPHCPYCRQLENELQNVSDTTVYVFLYPLESLHPGATATSRNIWCAEDRAAAWNNSLLKKEAPPSATCDSDPLKKLAILGDKLNINATPTLFFPDGHRVAGAIPVARLEKELNSSQAPRK